MKLRLLAAIDAVIMFGGVWVAVYYFGTGDRFLGGVGVFCALVGWLLLGGDYERLRRQRSSS